MNGAKTRPEPLLLTARELAQRLGVSERQVWNLHAAKRIPAAVRLRRSVRWRVADINQFVAAGCEMNSYCLPGKEAL